MNPMITISLLTTCLGIILGLVGYATRAGSILTGRSPERGDDVYWAGMLILAFGVLVLTGSLIGTEVLKLFGG